MRACILLSIALILTVPVALWGIIDAQSLTAFASQRVTAVFDSRAWFIMLTSSTLLLVCLWLALSRYGNLRLGPDDARPEFSTGSWSASTRCISASPRSTTSRPRWNTPSTAPRKSTAYWKP